MILFMIKYTFKPNSNDPQDLQMLLGQMKPKGLYYFHNPHRSNRKTGKVIKLHKASTSYKHDKLLVFGHRAISRLNLRKNN